MSYPAVSREFPVTALTEVLVDYPRWVIAEIVSEVITTERMLTFRHNPLDPNEFVPVMIKYQTHKNSERGEQYHNWYKSYTPLGVNRTLKIGMKQEAKKKNVKKMAKK